MTKRIAWINSIGTLSFGDAHAEEPAGTWTRAPWLDEPEAKSPEAEEPRRSSHNAVFTARPNQRIAGCSCGARFTSQNPNDEWMKHRAFMSPRSFEAEAEPRNGSVFKLNISGDGTNPENPPLRVEHYYYGMGRADERLAIDSLLEAVEKRMEGTSMRSHYEIFAEVRTYRKKTKEVRAVGIERGWYPKGSENESK